jgi:Spy/CpxP family protein refolding chaperone
MPKSKKLALLAALAVGAGVAATAVVAAGHEHGPFHGGGPFREEMAERHFDRLAEFLELSDTQREQIEALHQEILGEVPARFAALRENFARVHEMAGAEAPDPMAIGELVIAMHREHESIEADRDRFHEEAAKLLTPEQAERFEAWQAARPWPGEDGGPMGHRHPRR